MNKSKIINEMIENVEVIMRNKTKSEFDFAKTTERREVSNIIINKLEEVIENDNKQD